MATQLATPSELDARPASHALPVPPVQTPQISDESAQSSAQPALAGGRVSELKPAYSAGSGVRLSAEPPLAGQTAVASAQSAGSGVRLSAAYLPPNWFASVMGTGIVANAAASLPVQFTGLRTAATVVWALAAVWLLVLVVLTVVSWVRHFEVASGFYRDPVLGHFYGAPPMALMTVGAGALLLGKDWIGESAAVVVHSVLWTCGTLLGLFVAVFIPYTQFVRQHLPLSRAFGGWLMPVVPPMVSAATGALLIPYAPTGSAQVALMWACYGLFAFSLIAAAVVIPLIIVRLVRHGIGPAGAVPTYWIVLGPLGQSVTAVNLLSAAAAGLVGTGVVGAGVAGVAGAGVAGMAGASGTAGTAGSGVEAAGLDAGAGLLSAQTAEFLERFGIVFGVIVLSLAMAWLLVAVVLVWRTARTRRVGGPGLPFSLTWWSFTFPLGTCITGASALWAHTGLGALAALAVVLYLGLLCAWLTASLRTIVAAR